MPSRFIAVLLTLLAPIGTGHVYLRRSRRAFAWLFGSALAAIAIALSLHAAGERTNYLPIFLAGCAMYAVVFVGCVIDAVRVDVQEPWVRAGWLRIIAFGAFGLAMSFAVRAFVMKRFVEAFKIPSGSMMPTLYNGDHIFVDKLGSTPKRGDVIVFAYPENPQQDFVKRVVGFPGDRMEFRAGRVLINGWQIPHCAIGSARVGAGMGELDVEFLGDASYLVFLDALEYAPAEQGPYVVAPDQLFVLGDNRNNSHDSRMWFKGEGGGVPFANVRGPAMFRWLSMSEGHIDTSRSGPSIREVRLPASLEPSLSSPLADCMKTRPPPERRLPPPSL